MENINWTTPNVINLIGIFVLTALLLGCNRDVVHASDDTERAVETIAKVELVRSDGTKHEQRFSELLDGRPVYLKFWASWCQSCMKEMPHFQSTQQRLGDNLQVIGVNIGINESDEEINATIQKFGLSMPTVVDSLGELKKRFNFHGTPYHLVLNPQGEVIHSTYEASDTLDALLAELAADGEYDGETPSHRPEIASTSSDQRLPAWMQADKITGILFTAEWCEWYLAETRPDMARTCVEAQRRFNALERSRPDIEWRTLLSPLWTGQEEVASYESKHNIQHTITADTGNALFEHFHITQFPTVVLLEGTTILARIEGENVLSDQIEEILSGLPVD